MSRLKNSALLALAAGLALAQDGVTLMSPAVMRVAAKMACLCGSCKNTVRDCPMLECHYAKPARQKIIDRQAAGMSDAQVLKAAVKEEGLQALAEPPTDGFSLLAWVMPGLALAAGTLVLIWFLKRVRPARQTAAVPTIDQALLDKYHERIEKEMAKLD